MSRYLCIQMYSVLNYMFNVSIRECFSVLNVFIVCIRNTARSKSIPLLCTHVDSYKFSTVHPPRYHVLCQLSLGLDNVDEVKAMFLNQTFRIS